MSEVAKEGTNGTVETKDTTRPIQYAIYKGINGKSGAIQFRLMPAYKGRNDEGAVFIEAAPAIGPSKYDWAEQKITFAMSIKDIGQFLVGTKTGNVDLFHDPGAGSDKKGQVTKKLTLKAGETAGTFFIFMSEKSAAREKKVSLPVSADEMRILVTLFEAAIPKMLNW